MSGALPDGDGAGVLESAPAAEGVSIGAQTTAGVAWSAAQKWAIRLTGFASVALLARMLDAQDFGLVAAATTIMPLLYLLSDLGFSTYVVQADRVNERVLGTAFWFSAVAGTVLALALAGVAPLIARLLAVQGLDTVLQVLSVAVLAAALGSVPTAILKRRMDFRAIALRSGIASVLGQVVAVVTALAGWGAWALVAQLVVAQVLTCVLIWFAARWVPGREFSTTEFRKMAKFGSNVVGIEVVAVLRLWGENAVIMLTLGVAGLGYLSIAQRLIQIAQDLTVSSVTSVTTVAFARIRAGEKRLRAAYLRVVEVTYAVAIPFVAGLSVASPLVIPLVFGDGWSRSVGPAQVWAMASFMVMGAVVDHSLFYGAGRPGTWFVYAALIDALTLGVTTVVVRFDLIGVAVGFACVALFALLTRTFMVARLLGTGPLVVFAPFARAVAVLGGCSLVVWASLTVTASLSDVARLILAALAAGGCYWPMLKWLLPQASDTLGRLLVRRLGGRLAERILPARRRPA